MRTDYKEIAYKIQQFKRADSSAVGMHIFNLLEFKSQDLPVLYGGGPLNSNQNSDMVTWKEVIKYKFNAFSSIDLDGIVN